MSRPRLAAFCLLMMMVFVVGSGVVWGQSVKDVYFELLTEYRQEFQNSSDRLPEYIRFTAENTFRPDGLVKMMEQARALVNTPSSENARRQLCETIADEMFQIRQVNANKAKELFPDDLRQKMQTRQFQLAESVMRRLDSLENANDVFCANSLVMGGLWLDVLPDFLELTPQQRNLITKLQKNNEVERLFLMSQARVDQIEKSNELQALMAKTDASMNDEEREKLFTQISRLEEDVFRHIVPQVKELTQEYRKNFLRVLTDAQKAKIAAVMDDMPDYMKNLFAVIDREGGDLSILNNWQPGMGVPDFPNPIREAPRKRTNSGGRTFPNN
jgi:hypothetical protein